MFFIVSQEATGALSKPPSLEAILIMLVFSSNSQAIPSNTSPLMTYEEVQITPNPLVMWGDTQQYLVSGFQNTPCGENGVFYRPSIMVSPSGGITTVGDVHESFSVPSQYTVGGFEHTPCNGGLFLRRSADVVTRGTEISVSLSTSGVCVFVESAFWRSGGFLTSLEQHGFVPYTTNGFVWSISTPPLMYCTGADHVTLPATTTSHLVHGICTL